MSVNLTEDIDLTPSDEVEDLPDTQDLGETESTSDIAVAEDEAAIEMMFFQLEESEKQEAKLLTQISDLTFIMNLAKHGDQFAPVLTEQAGFSEAFGDDPKCWDVNIQTQLVNLGVELFELQIATDILTGNERDNSDDLIKLVNHLDTTHCLRLQNKLKGIQLKAMDLEIDMTIGADGVVRESGKPHRPNHLRDSLRDTLADRDAAFSEMNSSIDAAIKNVDAQIKAINKETAANSKKSADESFNNLIFASAIGLAALTGVTLLIYMFRAFKRDKVVLGVINKKGITPQRLRVNTPSLGTPQITKDVVRYLQSNEQAFKTAVMDVTRLAPSKLESLDATARLLYTKLTSSTTGRIHGLFKKVTPESLGWKENELQTVAKQTEKLIGTFEGLVKTTPTKPFTAKVDKTKAAIIKQQHKLTKIWTRSYLKLLKALSRGIAQVGKN